MGLYMDTIFVQIASYRDTELFNTLKCLIDNASKPHNLHICVNFQRGKESSIEDFLSIGFNVDDYRTFLHNGVQYDIILMNHDMGTKLTVIDIDHFLSKGACWARNLIQQFYDNEKYTLQLDSHHRFVDDWDTICIGMIEGLRSKSKKPVLTAYLPSFIPATDPVGRVLRPWVMHFDRFIPEGAVFFTPAAMDKDQKEPLLTRFYSGHFTFADGDFAVKVKHDPNYFFHGEEISIAVRAFTHGYDFYHPHVLIAWHEYTRAHRTKVWDDHTSHAKSKGSIEKHWVERNDESHERNKTLFSMDGRDYSQIQWGEFGFGKERTLQDYEMFSGLIFKKRACTRDVIDKKPPNFSYNYSYDEMASNAVRSNDVRILFDKRTLPKDVNDYLFFYVGCHDSEGKEIYRMDWDEHQVKLFLSENGNYIDKRLIFLDDRIPKKYTVWPHSKSLGWINKTENNI